MYKEIIKPTLVLILISSLVAALLAVTYNITGVGNISTTLSNEVLTENIPFVMPNATKLENIDIDTEFADLLGVYKDTGGAGTAFQITTKGYGGEMQLLVGINSNGEVTGVSVLSHQETPGLGTKATVPDFLNQFVGKAGNVSIDTNIDAISGSTTSSKAVTEGVNRVFEIYQQVKGDL